MGAMDKNKLIQLAWDELLKQCANDPEKAIRLVMVNKRDVEIAMTNVWNKINEKDNCTLSGQGDDHANHFCLSR